MASKIWVLPATTPGCEIKITNGGWIIADNPDRANFGGNAKADEDGNVSGEEEGRPSSVTAPSTAPAPTRTSSMSGISPSLERA